MCYITLYNMCHVILYMTYVQARTEQNMLYNMRHVMLYNMCHVMLYNICYVTLYNIIEQTRTEHFI